MKYPKPWNASGKTFVSSYRAGERVNQICVHVSIDRPGTPDEGRTVQVWLSHAQAEALQRELSHHIELVGKRLNAEVQS